MSPLPSGIRLLLWLQFRGRLRRIFQQAKTPRGAVLSLFGLLLVVAWLAPTLIAVAVKPEAPNLELSRAVFPVALFLFTLLGVFSSAGERALYFSPSEIEFLFQAPYSRRQILIYRIFARNMSLFLVALIFSVFLMRACVLWPAAYLGALLGLIFLNLAATAIALVSEYVAERAFTRVRRFILTVGLVAIVAGFLRGINFANSDDALAMLLSISSHPVAQVVLLPFQPLARTFTAATYGELFFWAPIALGLNGLLFGVVVLLDAHYEDTAVALSEKLYVRGQKAKRSGGLQVRATSARFRLPALPRLGGAGVIVWMQLTHLVRAGRTLVLIMMPLVFMIGALYFMAREDRDEATVLGGAAAFMCFYISLFFPNIFRFDFRGHIDNMDTLKAMPFSAIAITVGELFTPVFATVLVQALLIGAAAVLSGTASPRWLLGVAALFPVNLLLYGVENLIFLLYPVRLATTGPGDMQFMGRQVMLIFVKMFFVAIAVGIAGLAGAAVYLVVGPNEILAGGVGIAVLSVMALCFIPIVAEAYRRFDPSQHMPA